MNDYSEFSDRKTGDNLLASISSVAQDQVAAEAAVAAAEEALAIAQGKLRHIQEHLLPGLMDEARQTAITTSDGLRVEVKETIRASIPKAGEDVAFSWLQEHDAGSLIKRKVVVEFARDEEAWAKKFIADMAKRKKPLNAKVSKTVHPQTLAAFLREKLEAGADLPLSLFGAFRQRTSQVKLPK